MAVEVPGEDPVERVVRERQGERIALDVRRARCLTARFLEHPCALVEADDVPVQVSREEPGSAGDVERPCRGERGDRLDEARELVLPAGAVAIGVEVRTPVPIVVFGCPAVVVLLHRSSRMSCASSYVHRS